MVRPIVSAIPPGANATMKRIGFAGNDCCADAGPATTEAAARAASSLILNPP